MADKLVFRTHSAESISRFIENMAMPAAFTRKDGVKGGFEFHFEFSTGKGFLCTPIEHKKSDHDSVNVFAQFEMNPFIAKDDIAGIPFGSEVMSVLYPNPNSLPKYRSSQMVQVDITDLPHFERYCMVQPGVDRMYGMHRITSEWMLQRFKDFDMPDAGEFCLVPAGSTGYLLFLDSDEQTDAMALSLYTFI